jgi:DNA-binding transcriptional LysR family regulator
MKFFIAVAEELHFTRASARLRIAQPHLSHQIRQLEREIGVELFARTKRSVALTAAGHTFLQHVRTILDTTSDAINAAQRASRGETGRIRLGFNSAAAFGVVPTAIARFRRAYADVELLPRECNSEEGLEAVRAGELDLCLLTPPRNVDSSVNIEPVWLEPLAIVLPPKHPLAHMREIGLQRLKSDSWIMARREVASRLHDEIMGACATAGFEPRVVQRFTRITTAMSLVASGIGVTLLPITVARLGIGGAIYRRVRPRRIGVPIALAWRQDRTSPALARFMAFVRECAPR